MSCRDENGDYIVIAVGSIPSFPTKHQLGLGFCLPSRLMGLSKYLELDL